MRNPGLKIVPARARDISSILDISEECELSPWSKQDYLDEVERESSVFLIAKEASGEQVGFLTGRLNLSSEAEIYNIGVRSEYRKRGIGTGLLQAFLSVCTENKVQSVFLDVRASNDGAVGFYLRNGFETIATRKHFYRDPPEDAFVMKLALRIS